MVLLSLRKSMPFFFKGGVDGDDDGEESATTTTSRKSSSSSSSSSSKSEVLCKRQSKKDVLRQEVACNVKCPPVPLKPERWGNEIAIVACGCFWNPQLKFQRIKGVRRVIVGYTGGEYIQPTFTDLRDHCQALFIEYNPKKVSYEEILTTWNDNDYPWEMDDISHHRSAIFYRTERQYDIATKFLQDLVVQQQQQKSSTSRPTRSRQEKKLYVDLSFALTFYQAETMHQDYMKKQIIRAKEQLMKYATNKSSSGLYVIPE